MIEQLPLHFKRNIVNIPSTNCWEWLGKRIKGHYGVYKSYKAYRYSWETLIGKVPRGMHVHHACFNPACVNIDHLQILTRADNKKAGKNSLPFYYGKALDKVRRELNIKLYPRPVNKSLINKKLPKLLSRSNSRTYSNELLIETLETTVNKYNSDIDISKHFKFFLN